MSIYDRKYQEEGASTDVHKKRRVSTGDALFLCIFTLSLALLLSITVLMGFVLASGALLR